MPRLAWGAVPGHHSLGWSSVDLNLRSRPTHAGLQGPYTGARLCLFHGVPSGSWAYLSLRSGCALKDSRVSCLLITLSSSSALASLSRSITPISGRICSWASSRSCSGVWAGTERIVAERRRLVIISPPCVLRVKTLRQPQGSQVPGGLRRVPRGLDGFGPDIREPPMGRPALKLGSIYECRSKWRAALFIANSFCPIPLPLRASPQVHPRSSS